MFLSRIECDSVQWKVYVREREGEGEGEGEGEITQDIQKIVKMY